MSKTREFRNEEIKINNNKNKHEDDMKNAKKFWDGKEYESFDLIKWNNDHPENNDN